VLVPFGLQKVLHDLLELLVVLQSGHTGLLIRRERDLLWVLRRHKSSVVGFFDDGLKQSEIGERVSATASSEHTLNRHVDESISRDTY